MSSERYEEAKQLFGDRLQLLRKERGITQEQLAEAINKSVEHTSYIERAVRAPSFETILDFAKALKVSVLYLMSVTPQAEISTNFIRELHNFTQRLNESTMATTPTVVAETQPKRWTTSVTTETSRRRQRLHRAANSLLLAATRHQSGHSPTNQ